MSRVKNENLQESFVHGAKRHATITVDTYGSELRDSEGFIGDRASNRAFRTILENCRKRMRKAGADPLGDQETEELSKKDLDKLLSEGEVEAAGLVHTAVEEFAQELAAVTARFLKLRSWRETTHIVVGGGFRASRIGELAIGRAAILLKTEHENDVELRPIRHDPDEAGLIGNVHLIAPDLFEDYDSMLGVDIGGSNIRAGLIELNIRKNGSLRDSKVVSSDLWRHVEERVSREDAVKRLAKMLRELIDEAEKKHMHVAPYIGVGCPGFILDDGSIEKGGHNLPGNWESTRFNLPNSLRELIPRVGGEPASVMMHNDAVVQGLSETPWMADVEHWGVLTIGTGLGNARFTNCLFAKG